MGTIGRPDKVMPEALLDWIARTGVAEICIVSPHLDDAAFSVGGLLLSPFGRCCRVLTVFTAPAHDAETAWARAAGFNDVQEELSARRREDELAMKAINVRAEHLAHTPDCWGWEQANDVHSRIAGTGVLAQAQGLVLLPAGAGGSRLRGPLGRGWSRLLRRPQGATSHPEHKQVRDLLLPLLLRSVSAVGFYAELPYIWNDRLTTLMASLAALAESPLVHRRLQPDVRRKAQLVQLYPSQVALTLGAKQSWRDRVLAHDEDYFIVDRA